MIETFGQFAKVALLGWTETHVISVQSLPSTIFALSMLSVAPKSFVIFKISTPIAPFAQSALFVLSFVSFHIVQSVSMWQPTQSTASTASTSSAKSALFTSNILSNPSLSSGILASFLSCSKVDRYACKIIVLHFRIVIFPPAVQRIQSLSNSFCCGYNMRTVMTSIKSSASSPNRRHCNYLENALKCCGVPVNFPSPISTIKTLECCA